MLLPRIIPFLLIHKGALYKTINFKKPKYIGDPLNAVRIFNEKLVDELAILDIDASIHNKEPNYKLIKNLASQCRMPITYGGGVKNVDQIKKIVGLGVEKVSISSAAIKNPNIVLEASRHVGSQSISISLDIKRVGTFKKEFRVFIHNGTIPIKDNPKELSEKLQNAGAGELIINSIEKDGSMSGYDFELIDYFKDSLSIPFTVVGGASSYSDLENTVKKYKLIGLGAGSLFVFKGKYRAVLIQYPNIEEKERIFNYFI